MQPFSKTLYDAIKDIHGFGGGGLPSWEAMSEVATVRDAWEAASAEFLRAAVMAQPLGEAAEPFALAKIVYETYRSLVIARTGNVEVFPSWELAFARSPFVIAAWDDVANAIRRGAATPNAAELRLRSHATAPFGFDVAMMHLRDGGRVRRAAWREGHYLERHLLPDGSAEIRYVMAPVEGLRWTEAALQLAGSMAPVLLRAETCRLVMNDQSGAAEGVWSAPMVSLCADDWQTAP